MPQKITKSIKKITIWAHSPQWSGIDAMAILIVIATTQMCNVMNNENVAELTSNLSNVEVPL